MRGRWRCVWLGGSGAFGFLGGLRRAGGCPKPLVLGAMADVAACWLGRGPQTRFRVDGEDGAVGVGGVGGDCAVEFCAGGHDGGVGGVTAIAAGEGEQLGFRVGGEIEFENGAAAKLIGTMRRAAVFCCAVERTIQRNEWLGRCKTVLAGVIETFATLEGINRFFNAG